MKLLYLVQYGDIELKGEDGYERHEAGDVVELAADDAAFLGDQVTRAPERLTGPDTDAINNSVGHELDIINQIPTRDIEQSYGPSDDVNDIDVGHIEDTYRKRDQQSGTSQ